MSAPRRFEFESARKVVKDSLQYDADDAWSDCKRKTVIALLGSPEAHQLIDWIDEGRGSDKKVIEFKEPTDASKNIFRPLLIKDGFTKTERKELFSLDKCLGSGLKVGFFSMAISP